MRIMFIAFLFLQIFADDEFQNFIITHMEKDKESRNVALVNLLIKKESINIDFALPYLAKALYQKEPRNHKIIFSLIYEKADHKLWIDFFADLILEERFSCEQKYSIISSLRVTKKTKYIINKFFFLLSHQDLNINIKQQIIESFGYVIDDQCDDSMIYKEQIAKQMFDIIKNKNEHSLKISAAFCLGSLEEVKFIDNIIEVGFAKKDYDLVLYAIYSFQFLFNHNSLKLKTLKRILQTEDKEFVKKVLIIVRKIYIDKDSELFSLLQNFANNSTGDMRIETIRTVGSLYIHYPSFEDVVIELHSSEEFRTIALEILSFYPVLPKSLLPLAVEGVKQRKSKTQLLYSLESLGSLKNMNFELVYLIESCMSNSDQDIHNMAIKSLDRVRLCTRNKKIKDYICVLLNKK